MFAIQMAMSFRPGDVAPVKINGEDKRLHWVAPDRLAILPADTADTSSDERTIMIEMFDEHDPDSLRTFWCSDAVTD